MNVKRIFYFYLKSLSGSQFSAFCVLLDRYSITLRSLLDLLNVESFQQLQL
jgi:hypothetical protein